MVNSATEQTVFWDSWKWHWFFGQFQYVCFCHYYMEFWIFIGFNFMTQFNGSNVKSFLDKSSFNYLNQSLLGIYQSDFWNLVKNWCFIWPRKINLMINYFFIKFWSLRDLLTKQQTPFIWSWETLQDTSPSDWFEVFHSQEQEGQLLTYWRQLTFKKKYYADYKLQL